MRELKTSHVECGYCDERLTDTPEAFATHDAACERNPLANRVRELEAQLAWTPVSDGLPTEPGWYVFFRNDESAPDLINKSAEFWPSTDGWNDNFQGVNPDAPDWGYTKFRRIELPEAK